METDVRSEMPSSARITAVKAVAGDGLSKDVTWGYKIAVSLGLRVPCDGATTKRIDSPKRKTMFWSATIRGAVRK